MIQTRTFDRGRDESGYGTRSHRCGTKKMEVRRSPSGSGRIGTQCTCPTCTQQRPAKFSISPESEEEVCDEGILLVPKVENAVTLAPIGVSAAAWRRKFKVYVRP